MNIPRKRSCILLIVPPVKVFSSRVFPLGLGYIASVLEKDNYDVKIIDYTQKRTFYLQEALREIVQIAPDFVGFTVNSISYYSTKMLISCIRNKLQKTKILIGGPHVSALPSESLRDLKADFSLVGEGETVLPEIIRRVESGFNNFDDINGIAFWNNDSACFNPGINIVEELDKIPFPVQQSFFHKEFGDIGGDIFSLKSPVASVLISRPYLHIMVKKNLI